MKYVYEFCGWNEDYNIDVVSDIIVDTIFEIPKYVCIKFKGTILKAKHVNKSNSYEFNAILTDSNDGIDCTIDTFDSWLVLTNVGRNQTNSTLNNITVNNFNSFGTYCAKIVSLGDREYELKYKQLYQLVDEMMFITDSTFRDNEISYGNGGAVAMESDELHNDYIRIILDDVLFESNVNNFTNGTGGAFYRVFGQSPSDSYDYIAGLDFYNVQWINNRAQFGGALGIEQLRNVETFDGNIFKTLIRIKDNIFLNNYAFGGGAVFIDGGNTFIMDSLFHNNTANDSGGAVYINSSLSGVTLLNTNITHNNAQDGNGGGFYNVENSVENIDYDIKLISCLGFYNILFQKNLAAKGGAFYLNIVGSKEAQSNSADNGDTATCLKVVNNDFSGNNDTTGNQVFLSLTGGELAPWVVAEWCENDPSICQAFKTSLVYLCMQVDSIEDGLCDELRKALHPDNVNSRRVVTENSNTTYSPAAYIRYVLTENEEAYKRLQPFLFLNPGASVILEIYGWDNLANEMKTIDYDVDLNDTSPVTFTSKASKFDNSAYVLPLFVDKGTVGQRGKGALIDPTDSVNQLPYAIVEVVPCDPGYYQVTDPNDADLFTCTPCVYEQYSMATDECRKCEIGMKCAGTNQTYMLKGYYGQLEDESDYLTNPKKSGKIDTQICPNGYCCSLPINYKGITFGCLFDPLGVTGEIDPPLLCGNGTNRDWRVPLCGKCLDGFSETSSKTGQCLKCTSNSGLWGTLLPNIIVGLALIAFYMKKGLSPQNIDHPFIVYTTKSALYVFQLLPYLTFQSTVEIIAPIAQVFSLSVDMFSGNQANCILANMDGRTKVSLNLLPGACYAILLFFVYIAIQIYVTYKFKKSIETDNEIVDENQTILDNEEAIAHDTTGKSRDANDHKWGRALSHTGWNIILMVYAQITATLVKLIDCRPLGNQLVMFYQGSIDCYDWIHVICYMLLFCCFLFPFILMFLLFRARKRWGQGYLRRLFPSLILNYRKDCWWFSSFSLFRRFLIIVISALPAQRSDVTSTFLAIIVGLIFAFHLLLQPMHWRVNNFGETYVWFIALAIATVNIIDFSNIKDKNDVQQLQLLLTLLVFALFVPMPILIVSFIGEKLPVTFHTSFNEEDEAPIVKTFGPYGSGEKKYQLIIRKKIKKEEKVIEFNKEHFDELRKKAMTDDDKLKELMKDYDALQVIEQELDGWLNTNDNILNSTLQQQTSAIGSKDEKENSISSDEKELHKRAIMEKLTHEMLENEDVVIFSPDEINQIVQQDELQHTPVVSPQATPDLSYNNNGELNSSEKYSKTKPEISQISQSTHSNTNSRQKVLTEAWNNNQ